MKSFFKYLLATIIGTLVTFLLVFFISMGILGAIVSSQDKPLEIKSKSVLHVELTEPIVDRSSKNPFAGFDFEKFKPDGEIGLDEILNYLDKAKDDEKIEGILLDFTFIPSGSGMIEEVREALLDFKESGKFIYAYSDFYDQHSYYLATVADSIFMNPTGTLVFVGLKGEVVFIKNTLEMLGIEPTVIRHGKFKSAIEPLVNEKMSEANKEQMLTLIQTLWHHMLEGISQQREIPVEDLNRIADNLEITSSEDAVRLKLVDKTIYKDELLDLLREKMGVKENKKINTVALKRYLNTAPPRDYKRLPKDKIAVIYAMGDVIMGEGEEGNIGSERISSAIRDARLDTTIKAIVFRVNSGGGSALASEVIWREAKLAAETKPFVASFGDVAASGGYYIAVPADTILATPLSITGSIGVFGVLFQGQKFMNEKLGITKDLVKTNEYADIGNFFRSLKPAEKQAIQTQIEKIYDTFITHVGEGREMSKENVDSIGQGRVWSGISAKEIGLIDMHGGLKKAVDVAAGMAKIEKYRVLSLPKLEDPFEKLLKEMSGQVKSSFMKREFGSYYKYYEELKNLKDWQGAQARMPFILEIY
ncbi:MAG: signal peptide peptidase SppA [Bacteroidales bacterium]